MLPTLLGLLIALSTPSTALSLLHDRPLHRRAGAPALRHIPTTCHIDDPLTPGVPQRPSNATLTSPSLLHTELLPSSAWPVRALSPLERGQRCLALCYGFGAVGECAAAVAAADAVVPGAEAGLGPGREGFVCALFGRPLEAGDFETAVAGQGGWTGVMAGNVVCPPPAAAAASGVALTPARPGQEMVTVWSGSTATASPAAPSPTPTCLQQLTCPGANGSYTIYNGTYWALSCDAVPYGGAPVQFSGTAGGSLGACMAACAGVPGCVLAWVLQGACWMQTDVVMPTTVWSGAGAALRTVMPTGVIRSVGFGGSCNVAATATDVRSSAAVTTLAVAAT